MSTAWPAKYDSLQSTSIARHWLTSHHSPGSRLATPCFRNAVLTTPKGDHGHLRYVIVKGLHIAVINIHSITVILEGTVTVELEQVCINHVFHHADIQLGVFCKLIMYRKTELDTSTLMTKFVLGRLFTVASITDSSHP